MPKRKAPANEEKNMSDEKKDSKKVLLVSTSHGSVDGKNTGLAFSLLDLSLYTPSPGAYLNTPLCRPVAG